MEGSALFFFLQGCETSVCSSQALRKSTTSKNKNIAMAEKY